MIRANIYFLFFLRGVVIVVLWDRRRLGRLCLVFRTACSFMSFGYLFVFSFRFCFVFSCSSSFFNPFRSTFLHIISNFFFWCATLHDASSVFAPSSPPFPSSAVIRERSLRVTLYDFRREGGSRTRRGKGLVGMRETGKEGGARHTRASALFSLIYFCAV